ncbi:MAG: PKD repeat protein, partial [Paracoccaceae bacterium]
MKRHNYVIKSLLTGALIALFGLANAQYCASRAISTADSKIDRVTLAGNTTSIDENSATLCLTYTDNTSVSAPELTAGSTYTINIYHGTCATTHYQKRSTAWIDFNGNEVFEASEQLGAISVSNFGVGNHINTITFTVPSGVCGGSTRMRVVLVESNNPTPCGTYTWGETEDYTVDLVNPSTGLSSDFLVPSTAYTGTIIQFTNSNQVGYISHNWTVDGTPYTTTNAQHIFATAGTYSVKLVSENCLGKDSTTKTVTVINPTAPPVSNFISNKNVA